MKTLPKRILRFKDVQKLIPFSRSYIYDLISQGRFPLQVKLVEGGRGMGWWEHEIQDYINQRYTEHVTNFRAKKGGEK